MSNHQPPNDGRRPPGQDHPSSGTSAGAGVYPYYQGPPQFAPGPPASGDSAQTSRSGAPYSVGYPMQHVPPGFVSNMGLQNHGSGGYRPMGVQSSHQVPYMPPIPHGTPQSQHTQRPNLKRGRSDAHDDEHRASSPELFIPVVVQDMRDGRVYFNNLPDDDDDGEGGPATGAQKPKVGDEDERWKSTASTLTRGADGHYYLPNRASRNFTALDPRRQSSSAASPSDTRFRQSGSVLATNAIGSTSGTGVNTNEDSTNEGSHQPRVYSAQERGAHQRAAKQGLERKVQEDKSFVFIVNGKYGGTGDRDE